MYSEVYVSFVDNFLLPIGYPKRPQRQLQLPCLLVMIQKRKKRAGP
jgi:hypothetical protein